MWPVQPGSGSRKHPRSIKGEAALSLFKPTVQEWRDLQGKSGFYHSRLQLPRGWGEIWGYIRLFPGVFSFLCFSAQPTIPIEISLNCMQRYASKSLPQASKLMLSVLRIILSTLLSFRPMEPLVRRPSTESLSSENFKESPLCSNNKNSRLLLASEKAS